MAYRWLFYEWTNKVMNTQSVKKGLWQVEESFVHDNKFLKTLNCLCQKNTQTYFYPITHWGYSDGGGILDQNQKEKNNQGQVMKNLISQLQENPEPYKRLDLLSQLRPLLKPTSDNQHLTHLLNSSFQFFQYTQHTSQCWICMSLSPSSHIAISLPSAWLSEGNYTSFSQQKTTQLIGPVSDNVLLSASSNLTCINYYSPNYTGLKTPLPPSVPLRFSGTAQIITPTRNLHSLWDLCIFMSPP